MSQEAAKRAAAVEAVKLIEAGMVVGLGTGTTSEQMLTVLAERVQDGLSITGVATSKAIAERARALGIALAPGYPDFSRVDLTLDGADEVDPKGNLIKGGGGALLCEKLVAAASRRLVIMVDDSKHVEQLGVTRALPVEVVAFGWSATLERLRELGAEVSLRGGAQSPFQTDEGHFVADCRFGPISDPAGLQARLVALPGVVDTGLFLGMAALILTGRADGTCLSRTHLPAAPQYK